MKTRPQFKATAMAMVVSLALSGATLFAAAAKELRARGTLEKIDEKASTFVLKDVAKGTPLTYHWGKSTKFLRDGKTIALTDLKAGERLTIRYEQSGKEVMAKEVVVRPLHAIHHTPTAKPKAAPAS